MNASNRPQVDPDEILDGIRSWVEIETPTRNAAQVNKLVDLVEEGFRGIDAVIERVPGKQGLGDLLKVTSPWGGEGPGILVLCHLDTVHPMGTIDTKVPYRREGDSVFGPGIYDMKGGAYLPFYALRHLVREGKRSKLPVTILYMPDEEIGSLTSRDRIEAEARKAKYVLVSEPARDGGKVVTARKGVARFSIKATGRPAHAGSRHQDGRSANRELARQVIAIEEMTDYGRGVTTNVGFMRGGTVANVVPAEAEAEVDLRVPTQELAQEMVDRILALKAYDPDVKVEIEGELNRPPYVKDEGVAKLFDHASGLAKEIGFDLVESPMTGGGSDGNFTAALGVPTLDGLGVDGEGAHTFHEQLYFSSLAPRASLMIRLLETLE